MRAIAVAVTICLTTSGPPLLASLVVDSINFSWIENFDSLDEDVAGVNWQNDSTLTGWSLFRTNVAPEPEEPVPIQAYVLSDGSSSFGRFYSFGSSLTERALGGIGDSPFGDGISFPTAVTIPVGAAAGWIAVSLLNDTGTTLTQFSFSYTGEQWRVAGPNAQTMEFEYGIGDTFASVSWTKPTVGAPISFDFTSPQFDPADGPAPLDGNAAANRQTNLGGTVSGISWLPNKKLWLRWTEKNDQFADQGLAIDNFSFSVTAVPEPGAVLFGGVVCGLMGLVVVGRQCASRYLGKRCGLPTV